MAMNVQEVLMALLLGVGISAACGLRVFMPILLAGIAGKLQWISLASGFDWMSSWVAISAFGVASVVEIISYKVPFVDNLLDGIATPASVVAGTLVSASFLTNIDPMLQWILAMIVGGGAAGITQVGTVAARAASTTTTAGVANPILSIAESLGSVLMPILSIFAPVAAAILATGIIIVIILILRRQLRKWLPQTSLAKPKQDT